MEDKLPFDSAIHIKTPPLSEDILIKIKEVKAILSEEQRNNKWYVSFHTREQELWRKLNRIISLFEKVK